MNLKSIYTGNDFDYVVGALKIFQRLYFKVKNLSIDIQSNIPMQSGLSSSAALLTCLFQELSNYYKLAFDKNKICELAFITEYHELKNQVGKMDFYSCVSSGIIFYNGNTDAYILEKYKFNQIKIVLIDCGRNTSTKEVNMKKLERYRNKEVKFMQYLHKGNMLVDELKLELEGNKNLQTIGNIINDYQMIMEKYLLVSTDSINFIVNLCITNDAIAAKITGCGLGGYVFALIESGNTEKLLCELKKRNISYIMTESI